jgi:hypothetical protein
MKISPSKALPRLLVALTLTTALTVAALADPIPPFPPLSPVVHRSHVQVLPG